MKKIIFIAACCTLLLTGCVSQSDFDALNSEKDALATQVAELEAANETLLSEKEALRTENEALKASAETVPASADTTEAEPEYNYIGNLNSYKFHRLSCEYLPAEYNRVYYETREDAINDGMEACRRCSP